MKLDNLNGLLKYKLFFLLALIIAGIFTSISYYFFSLQIKRIEQRLELSPPVVIVDFTKIVSSYPSDISVLELEKLMVETNDIIYRLKDAGYLVLDSSNVIGAPDDIYLPVEEVIKK